MDRGENKHHNLLTVREYILRQATEKANQELFPTLTDKETRDIIDEIHNHQFKQALQATYDKTEIELPGLGVYIFAPKRAKNKLNKLYHIREMMEKSNAKDDPSKRFRWDSVVNDIALLEKKINQHYENQKFIKYRKTYFKDKRNSRRMEESSDTSKEAEATDHSDIKGQVENM